MQKRQARSTQRVCRAGFLIAGATLFQASSAWGASALA